MGFLFSISVKLFMAICWYQFSYEKAAFDIHHMNQCGLNRFTPRFNDMTYRVEHQKLNLIAAELPPGWVFGAQLGLRQTQALIKIKTIRRGKVPPSTLLLSIKLILFSNIAGGTLPLHIVLVLISACICRRPSWTPKTQPGGSSAATWLSFWCSTRLDMS